MAPTWQEREQGFEAKHAHDEAVRFRVTARRDKLFADWLAERCLADADRAAAIKAEILAIPDGPGHDRAVLTHAGGVAAASGVAMAEAILAPALAESGRRAREQLLAELPG